MKTMNAGLLVVTISMATAGCAHSPAVERDLLKTLLDREAARSAEQVFKAKYDPRDGRLVRQAEILQFLRDRGVSVESLPPDLRSALKKDRVVGVLVSRLEPLATPGETGVAPKRLDAINAMLLAWERDQTGGTGGSGIGGGVNGVWLGGPDRCPNDQAKCHDYDRCAECWGGLCLCVGWLRCPPCHPCRRCDGGSPNVASPDQ